MEGKKTNRITTFVCFDVETTGLNPENDRIIEIGALKVREGRITGIFSEFINPGIALPEMITGLTGITDDMLANAGTEAETVRRFLDFAGEDVMIGHNIIFDYGFVKTAAEREHISFERMGIDTLELCRKLHGDLDSRSLENMCSYYQITNNRAHRAYEDARATALLYVKLCNAFFDGKPEYFLPKPLKFKVKKTRPITMKQKNYLIDLLKYHKIDNVLSGMAEIDTLTQNEASRWIDRIILEHGRML